MKYVILLLSIFWFYTVMTRRRQGGSTDSPRQYSEHDDIVIQDGRDLSNMEHWEDDVPLKGPWSTKSKDNGAEDVPLFDSLTTGDSVDQDVPLPGPWNRPAPMDDTPVVVTERRVPGRDDDIWSSEDDISSPYPTTRPNEPRRQKRIRRELPKAAKQPEVVFVDDDVVAVRRAVAERADSPDEKRFTEAKQQSAAALANYEHVDPFTRILQQKSTLAASIILGEVLGSRGGRQKQLRRRY